MTSSAYIRADKNHAWPPFAGRLWLGNDYERVIPTTMNWTVPAE